MCVTVLEECTLMLVMGNGMTPTYRSSSIIYHVLFSFPSILSNWIVTSGCLADHPKKRHGRQKRLPSDELRGGWKSCTAGDKAYLFSWKEDCSNQDSQTSTFNENQIHPHKQDVWTQRYVSSHIQIIYFLLALQLLYGLTKRRQLS